MVETQRQVWRKQLCKEGVLPHGQQFQHRGVFPFLLKTSQERTERAKPGAGADRLLFVPANSAGRGVWEAARIHEVISAVLHQELLSAGAQGEHAHCWGDGDGDRIVSRQAAEVSQCGCGGEQTDGVQSFRVEARQHESLSEDSPDAEARESSQAAHWDFHGRG